MWLFWAYCTSRMKSITTSSFSTVHLHRTTLKKKCTCIYSTHITTYIKSCSKTSQTQHLNEKYHACNLYWKYSRLLCQKMVSDKCYANSYNIVDFYEIAVIVQYTMILCLVSLLYFACMGINILWILFNYGNTCKLWYSAITRAFPLS